MFLTLLVCVVNLLNVSCLLKYGNSTHEPPIIILYMIKLFQFFADVLAFVKEIGDLEEYGRDDVKKNKLRMVLTDNMLVHLAAYCVF